MLGITQCNRKCQESQDLRYGMQNRVLLSDLSDIEEVGMVFGWSDKELDSLCDLTATQRGIGEVEEHPQDHWDGDEAEALVGQGS